MFPSKGKEHQLLHVFAESLGAVGRADGNYHFSNSAMQMYTLAGEKHNAMAELSNANHYIPKDTRNQLYGGKFKEAMKYKFEEIRKSLITLNRQEHFNKALSRFEEAKASENHSLRMEEEIDEVRRSAKARESALADEGDGPASLKFKQWFHYGDSLARRISKDMLFDNGDAIREFFAADLRDRGLSTSAATAVTNVFLPREERHFNLLHGLYLHEIDRLKQIDYRKEQ